MGWQSVGEARLRTGVGTNSGLRIEVRDGVGLCRAYVLISKKAKSWKKKGKSFLIVGHRKEWS